MTNRHALPQQLTPSPSAVQLSPPPHGWGLELTRRVGEGTSSQVFEGVDLRDGSRVAVKVARTEADNRLLAEEAQTLLLVDSPRIPAVRALGRVPTGLANHEALADHAFVALAWVDGAPIDPCHVAPKERLALAWCIARDIAEALYDLHAMGLAHGDVKPSNIIVSRSETGLRATLIDLGYAGTGSQTAPLKGLTLRYAPYQLAQFPQQAMSRDLYALGLCLAEIVDETTATSDNPHDTLRSGSLPSPWNAICEALTAPQPSARPSARWVHDIARQHGPVRTTDGPPPEKRVRAAYLRLRLESLEKIAASTAATVSPDTPPWLQRAVDVIREAQALRTGSDETGARGSQTATAGIIEPLDPADRLAWLVSLVGVSAAHWPLGSHLAKLPEKLFAERLEQLARRLDPSCWTYQHLVQAIADAQQSSTDVPALDPIELAIALMQRPSPASAVMQAEALQQQGKLAPVHRALLAESLRASGDLGRAYAVVRDFATPVADALEMGKQPHRPTANMATFGANCTTVLTDTSNALVRGRVVLADILRRMGHTQQALALCDRLVSTQESNTGETTKASLPEDLVDRVVAIAARIVLDNGNADAASKRLAGQAGPACAEVLALTYLRLGDNANALEAARQGLASAVDDELRARLHCVMGMEAHGRGDAHSAFGCFEVAAQAAARAGAVVEEATYITGLAAAAVDAGFVSEALEASSRAIMLWNHLEQPQRQAYARLDRACALALAGDAQATKAEATQALSQAEATNDRRLQAYLAMLLADWTRGSERQYWVNLAREAFDARPMPSDKLRWQARALTASILEEATVVEADCQAHGVQLSAIARAEWWTARARMWLQGQRIGRNDELLAQLVKVVYEPLPVAVLAPALDAARSLAAHLGNGQTTRRLALLQSRVSQNLIEHVPPWLKEQTRAVNWMLDGETPNDPDATAKARNLELLVGGLTHRESLRGLLDRILDALVLWTGVERGLLLLRSGDNKLVVRAARNLAHRDLPQDQLNLSYSLAQRALATREPVVAVDATGELSELHESVHALGLRSVLAVPLVARGEVLGVAYLDDRVRIGAFGPHELSWVRLVASIAAMALADVREEQQLRRQARQAVRSAEQTKQQLAHARLDLEQAQRALASDARAMPDGFEGIVGQSPAVRNMLSLVQRVASSDLPVLVQGESGSGKELVARALHTRSSRSDGPFITENCSAIPETLFESTLFGHLRGAFTGADRRRIGLFEAAHGGTLFLDEVGEIPLQLQSKLLRVLQDGEVHPLGGSKATKVNVRVVAATNRDLRDLVTSGRFREDLYYRLNVVTITVPSLRERTGDVPMLVHYFLRKYAPNRELKITRAAWDKLESYDWPGNVRQLDNEVRRAIALCEDTIDESDLTQAVRRHGKTRMLSDEGMNLKARVNALERNLIEQALETTGGNQSRASRLLGISRFGLQKMMKRLELKNS